MKGSNHFLCRVLEVWSGLDDGRREMLTFSKKRQPKRVCDCVLYNKCCGKQIKELIIC